MVEYSRPVHKLSLIFRHLSAFMLVMYSRRALSVFFFFFCKLIMVVLIIFLQVTFKEMLFAGRFVSLIL